MYVGAGEGLLACLLDLELAMYNRLASNFMYLPLPPKYLEECVQHHIYLSVYFHF